mgnify:CR=1 FL=1|jgi:hypothetical protein
MTTLRQQIVMKRMLRNLRTWAPPISIGVIIGVLAYFAVEKLSDRPARTAAIAASSSPQAMLRARQQPVVNTSYAAAPFRNCAAARAAGAAPVHAGDPGYGEHLDGDGDGIGCEPYHR